MQQEWLEPIILLNYFDGYDTILTDGASNICRSTPTAYNCKSYDKATPITILDEATSSVDTEQKH